MNLEKEKSIKEIVDENIFTLESDKDLKDYKSKNRKLYFAIFLMSLIIVILFFLQLPLEVKVMGIMFTGITLLVLITKAFSTNEKASTYLKNEYLKKIVTEVLGKIKYQYNNLMGLEDFYGSKLFQDHGKSTHYTGSDYFSLSSQDKITEWSHLDVTYLAGSGRNSHRAKQFKGYFFKNSFKSNKNLACGEIVLTPKESLYTTVMSIFILSILVLFLNWFISAYIITTVTTYLPHLQINIWFDLLLSLVIASVIYIKMTSNHNKINKVFDQLFSYKGNYIWIRTIFDDMLMNEINSFTKKYELKLYISVIGNNIFCAVDTPIRIPELLDAKNEKSYAVTYLSLLKDFVKLNDLICSCVLEKESPKYEPIVEKKSLLPFEFGTFESSIFGIAVGILFFLSFIRDNVFSKIFAFSWGMLYSVALVVLGEILFNKKLGKIKRISIAAILNILFFITIIGADNFIHNRLKTFIPVKADISKVDVKISRSKNSTSYEVGILYSYKYKDYIYKKGYGFTVNNKYRAESIKKENSIRLLINPKKPEEIWIDKETMFVDDPENN